MRKIIIISTLFGVVFLLMLGCESLVIEEYKPKKEYYLDYKKGEPPPETKSTLEDQKRYDIERWLRMRSR